MSCHRVPLITLIASFILIYDCSTVFALNKRGIRSTNFYSFTYEDSKAWGGRTLVLRNGVYIKKDEIGETRSKLIAIRYVDLNADGRDEAVIDIRTWSYGSTPYIDDYYVFRYRKRILDLVFHTSRETPKRMVVNGRTITIVAPFWSDGSGPFCCPPYIETIVYRWRGSKLVVAGRKLREKHYPGMK